VLVCGIGPSKAPSCLGPAITSWDEDTVSEPPQKDDPPSVAWTVDARFEGGALKLTATAGASHMSPEQSKRLGSHPLAFP
jgi:hypothetical protein